MTSLSIKLDNGFSPKVKEGDKVAVGQLIAEKSIVGSDHEIHIARLLNVPIEGSSEYVIRRPGDRVEQGEVVAQKKGALGVGGKKVVSPVGGTVFSFNNSTSVLIIRTSEETTTQNLFCPVDGEVSVCDNEKIVIKTQKGVILAKDSLGEGSFESEVYAVEGQETSADSLKSSLKGKVVACKSLDRESLAKSLGLGAKAIVAEEIKEEDIENLKSKLIKTPIFIVDKENIDKILKADGRKIYVETEKKTLILQ